jgi:hypothetical protein
MSKSEYLFSSKRLGFRLIEDTDFDMLKESASFNMTAIGSTYLHR